MSPATSVTLEIAHSLSLVFMAFVANHAAWRGDYLAFTIIALVNIALNFLPILVCRYRRLSFLAALHQRENRAQFRPNKTI